MLKRIEEIPPELKPYADAYAVSAERFEKRTGKKRPPYMTMRMHMLDETLSFEDMCGILHVGTRERVRQIANEFFPNERSHEVRKCRTGKNCREMRQKRKEAASVRAERDFRRRSRIFKALHKHCARKKTLKLELVWHNGSPSDRSYVVGGKSTYMLRITSASGSGTSVRLYAKTRDFDRAKVAAHEQLGVLVEVRKRARVSELYIIESRAFLDTGLVYVLIPINGRTGYGGPEAGMSWKPYLVSKLA